MMTGESYFLDIAKISVAIAGFTGVVASVRHERDAPWTLNELAGLALMLEHSFAAVFFGLLPSLVSFAISDSSTLWLSLSFLLTLFLSYALLVQYKRLIEAMRVGSRPRQFKLLLIEFFGSGVIVLAFLVTNVLLWQGPAAYAWGCLWLLFAACRQFSVFLLFGRQKEDLTKPRTDANGKK